MLTKHTSGVKSWDGCVSKDSSMKIWAFYQASVWHYSYIWQSVCSVSIIVMLIDYCHYADND